jgi:prephenate dehydrogenase
MGLGQIGASIGLALADYQDKIHRIGFDHSRETINQAKSQGAIDTGANKLSGAVKEADVVLLALPLQEIRPVLESISPELKQDCLVIDTSPIKSPVLEWIREYLPEGRHYVGFTPVIQADYLEEKGSGIEAAAADLFQDSVIGVIGSGTASSEAISTALGLVQLLGASPYFSDPVEIDGLMSMIQILPQLLSAALLKASQDTPGWREARKLASGAYYQASTPFDQEDIEQALAAALVYNQENSTRVINELIRSLVEIRDLAADSSVEQIEDYLTALKQERDLWLADKKTSSWIEFPRVEVERKGIFSQLLGIKQPKKDPKD